MRITHNMLADKFNYNLQQNLNRMENYSQKLSTGKEFTRPTEDPIGTSKTMRFSNQIDRNDQYVKNMDAARGWLETTEAALLESNDTMQRVRELAVYGANDSLTAKDRDVLADEVEELYDHLVGQANAEYNQRYLFGGHQTGEKPFREVNAHNIEMADHAQTVHQEEDSYLQLAARGEEEVEVVFEEGDDGDELNVEVTTDNENETEEVTITLAEGGNTYREIAQAVEDNPEASQLLRTSIEGDPTTRIYPDDLIDNESHEVTLEPPMFAREPEAQGLQDGSYTLDIEDIDNGGVEAELKVEQEALQSEDAEGIFGTDEENITYDGDYNASLQLEVDEEIDENNDDEVSYSYQGHVYDVDGNYEYVSGEFDLDFDDGEQTVTIDLEEFGEDENISFDVDLEDEDIEDAHLQKGDRAVLNLQAEAAEDDHALDLHGDFEEGEASTQFNFSPDALENQELDFRFFTLDEDRESEDFGRVFDGSLEMEFNQQVREQEEALTFDYSREGLIEYRGDDGHRDQEISPYQDVTMNITGREAFGEDGEVLDAVLNTYQSLRNNDPEALGGQNLEQLDRGIERLLGRASETGARMNRLEAMEDVLEDENVLVREMRSDIEDIDIAETITEFTMQETAYHAALQTTARIMQPTLVDHLQ